MAGTRGWLCLCALLLPGIWSQTNYSVVFNGDVPLAVMEGYSTTFSFSLSRQPTASVTITMPTSLQWEVSPTEITITSGDWDMEWEVELSAFSDTVIEGYFSDSISFVDHLTTSNDANFDGIQIADIELEIADDNLGYASVSPLVGYDHGGDVVQVRWSGWTFDGLDLGIETTPTVECQFGDHELAASQARVPARLLAAKLAECTVPACVTEANLSAALGYSFTDDPNTTSYFCVSPVTFIVLVNGLASTNNSQDFHYMDYPQVRSISPQEIPIDSQATVTLSGYDLRPTHPEAADLVSPACIFQVDETSEGGIQVNGSYEYQEEDDEYAITCPSPDRTDLSDGVTSFFTSYVEVSLNGQQFTSNKRYFEYIDEQRIYEDRIWGFYFGGVYVFLLICLINSISWFFRFLCFDEDQKHTKIAITNPTDILDALITSVRQRRQRNAEKGLDEFFQPLTKETIERYILDEVDLDEEQQEVFRQNLLQNTYELKGKKPKIKNSNANTGEQHGVDENFEMIGSLDPDHLPSVRDPLIPVSAFSKMRPVAEFNPGELEMQSLLPSDSGLTSKTRDSPDMGLDFFTPAIAEEPEELDPFEPIAEEPEDVIAEEVEALPYDMNAEIAEVNVIPDGPEDEEPESDDDNAGLAAKEEEHSPSQEDDAADQEYANVADQQQEQAPQKQEQAQDTKVEDGTADQNKGVEALPVAKEEEIMSKEEEEALAAAQEEGQGMSKEEEEALAAAQEEGEGMSKEEEEALAAAQEEEEDGNLSKEEEQALAAAQEEEEGGVSKEDEEALAGTNEEGKEEA